MSGGRGKDGSSTSSSANTSSASGASGTSSSNEKSGGASQIVPVRVAGHEYKIRSSGDPEELQQIAGYVDRAMKRVRDRTGTVDTLDVAVLTCLNLGREILGLRQRDQQADDSKLVDADQLRSLIERVEAVIVGERAVENPAADQAAEPAETTEGARTLELPSVEALRDRNAASGSSSADLSASEAAAPDDRDAMSESRVAAGGRRDRAS